MVYSQKMTEDQVFEVAEVVVKEAQKWPDVGVRASPWYALDGGKEGVILVYQERRAEVHFEWGNHEKMRQKVRTILTDLGHEGIVGTLFRPLDFWETLTDA